MFRSAAGGHVGAVAYHGFTAYLATERTVFRVEVKIRSQRNCVSPKKHASAGIDDLVISSFDGEY